MRKASRVAVPILALAAVLVLSALQPLPGHPAGVAAAVAPNDWAQVQKNPQRTGFSNETLGTGFRVAWTHPFQPERVYPQVQPIIHQSTVFVGTETGNMYGMDSRTGAVRWTFKADGPIMSSAAADNGRVFFGAMDGAVYALDALTGAQLWKQKLTKRSGFSTAPVLADNRIMLGGRDGYFYALNPADGAVLWSYKAGAPILQTAASDNGTVFFGAMDMHVYALNSSDGTLSWKSERIKGLALKDYWPVVYQGRVFVVPMADSQNPGISPGFPFTWHDNRDWMARFGPAVAAGNLTQVADAMNAQDTVMASYQANPSRFTKTLVILDEANGQESMVAPHFAAQTMNGATTPPAVDRDGKLIVPVMFMRSGWGRLDLAAQRITDILYDGRDYRGQPVGSSKLNPAGTGNTDENLNVSAASNLVLAFHTQEGNANYTGAFDLDARRWIPIDRGWTNGQMWNNTQGGGGNPASISDGMIYHLSEHELVARTAQ